MSKKRLPTIDHADQKTLADRIHILQQELGKTQKETLAFEAILRPHIGAMIVAEQELFT